MAGTSATKVSPSTTGPGSGPRGCPCVAVASRAPRTDGQLCTYHQAPAEPISQGLLWRCHSWCAGLTVKDSWNVLVRRCRHLQATTHANTWRTAHGGTSLVNASMLSILQNWRPRICHYLPFLLFHAATRRTRRSAPFLPPPLPVPFDR